MIPLPTIWDEFTQPMVLSILVFDSLSPENVEDLPVGMDPDEDVGHGHELEVGLFRVGEEHLASRNRKLHWLRESHPSIFAHPSSR